MRYLLLMGATALLFGAIGCASEEEQRREKIADQKQMWGGDLAYMPDKILEMGEYAPQTPPANKTPTTNPAPTVVQASAQTPGTPNNWMTQDSTPGGVR